jgi:peptidoglycan hydrolase-like amidase
MATLPTVTTPRTTPLPNINTPLVDRATGLIAQEWFQYFQSHQKLTQLPDVSRAVAPTNGQVLVYNATTKLWTPGAN